MVRAVAICILVAAVLGAAWYLIFVAYNRRKARLALAWLEKALSGQGQVLGIRWMRPSLFQAPLRLRTSVFHHPCVMVRLAAHELPLGGLMKWWRREPDTLVFEADLDFPPGFNLEVRNHRWCGRTTRKFSPEPSRWEFQPSLPIVLTSRRHWEREVTSMMNALLSCRDREFLSLSFSRRSPHFSATVVLDSISPASQKRSNLFETLRELAAGASTFR